MSERCFGVCGRSRRISVVPLYIMFGCYTLPYAFLSPLSPEILKCPLRVNMCPNITAVTNISTSDGGGDNGYALKAAKDSVGGVCSFVGALLAGFVADKVRNVSGFEEFIAALPCLQSLNPDVCGRQLPFCLHRILRLLVCVCVCVCVCVYLGWITAEEYSTPSAPSSSRRMKMSGMRCQSTVPLPLPPSNSTRRPCDEWRSEISIHVHHIFIPSLTLLLACSSHVPVMSMSSFAVRIRPLCETTWRGSCSGTSTPACEMLCAC